MNSPKAKMQLLQFPVSPLRGDGWPSPGVFVLAGIRDKRQPQGPQWRPPSPDRRRFEPAGVPAPHIRRLILVR